MKKMSLNIILILLLLLWVSDSLDKLMDFDSFKNGILNQPLPSGLATLAIYTLPVLEVLIALLLIIQKYQLIGLWFSSLLMFTFTAYVATGLLGAWEKLPCGCGSVISGMSWSQHLWFNLFFLVVSIMGIILKNGK